MTKINGNSYLLQNLILFGRLLRILGLDINPGRLIDLVLALEYVDIGRREDFYHTASSLLVHDVQDLPLFALAFDLFWRRRVERDRLFSIFPAPRNKGFRQPILTAPLLEQAVTLDPHIVEDLNNKEAQPIIEVARTYSRREMLRHLEFSRLTAAEMSEVKWFIAQLQWQLGSRRTRRFEKGSGTLLDLRRALRNNLRYGGEFVERPTRRHKYKPRPLVILADISGSMERYSRLLLHFIYSLAKGLPQEVETFVFSTHLTRITRQLRLLDIDLALQKVADEVDDWAGGTRIGQALKQFNFLWGRRVLGRGAIVLLISDGWDRGEPHLLRTEIARLQRCCHRLIWLNPYLGHAKYEPLTRGMQAALPHIDDFLPVHNLASLEELGQHLARLDEGGRPFPRTYGKVFK